MKLSAASDAFQKTVLHAKFGVQTPPTAVFWTNAVIWKQKIDSFFLIIFILKKKSAYGFSYLSENNRSKALAFCYLYKQTRGNSFFVLLFFQSEISEKKSLTGLSIIIVEILQKKIIAISCFSKLKNSLRKSNRLNRRSTLGQNFFCGPTTNFRIQMYKNINADTTNKWRHTQKKNYQHMRVIGLYQNRSAHASKLTTIDSVTSTC